MLSSPVLSVVIVDIFFLLLMELKMLVQGGRVLQYSYSSLNSHFQFYAKKNPSNNGVSFEKGNVET